MTPSVFAENLDAEEFVLFPFAGPRRSIGFGDLPRQRQHQRDGMLGRGDRIAERRVHHDDAARGRRRNVDIVDADAGAADHFQAFGLLQHLGRDLGRGADRKTVEAVDGLGELVLVLAEIGLEIDLDAAILENLDGGGRQRIGDQNAGGHGGIPLRSAQPAQHVGIGFDADCGGAFGLDGHAVELQQRHAEIVAGGEILDDAPPPPPL